MTKDYSSFLENLQPQLRFGTRESCYVDIFLAAIVESYSRIDQTPAKENDIRDRFYWHLQRTNPLTKDLIDRGILFITFERCEKTADEELSRVDLTFFISDYFPFDVECKLLFRAPSKNEPYLSKGLLRYVEVKYAEQNDHAAMMGFVVEGVTETICTDLIEKVDKYHPTVAAPAVQSPLRSEWNYSFVSQHLRHNGRDITIYHLLFSFCGKGAMKINAKAAGKTVKLDKNL